MSALLQGLGHWDPISLGFVGTALFVSLIIGCHSRKMRKPTKGLLPNLIPVSIPKQEEVFRGTLPPSFRQNAAPHWQPVWNEPIRSALDLNRCRKSSETTSIQ